MKGERILILVLTLSTIAYMGNWFGIRDLLLAPAPVALPQIGEKTTESTHFSENECDMEIRKIYAATLRNLLYNGALPDGTTAELPVDECTQFAVTDVDTDGKEELVVVYDPGIVADAKGYIIDCDRDTKEIYIQFEEFPAFIFLSNGNLKVLSSHNQGYGDMWPYLFYQYCAESDTYELIGYVNSVDKDILALNGIEEQYPKDVDISGSGTVYYIGKDTWGTEPVDKKDYLSWLKRNYGDDSEKEISFLALTEENIVTIEPKVK